MKYCKNNYLKVGVSVAGTVLFLQGMLLWFLVVAQDYRDEAPAIMFIITLFTLFVIMIVVIVFGGSANGCGLYSRRMWFNGLTNVYTY